MIRLALAVLWLLHFLPLWVLDLLAYPVGVLAYALMRERRHVGLTNLSLCFPSMPLPERHALIRQNFHAMARMLLEYGVVWWASTRRLTRLVSVHNLDYLTQHAHENVILFCPHFVGFEIAAIRLNLEVSLVSVYSNQKNPVLNARMYAGRNRFANAHIVSRQAGLRSIIKAMKNHAPFLYLPDQDFGARDSVFVPFFSGTAATITGLARIARMTHARVVPAVARRVGGRYQLEFFPAWDDYPSADETADARRMNAFIEQRVLEQPEQYFWLHKRFKTRPPGQTSVYC